MMAVIHAEDARLNREVIRQTDNAGALENVAQCRPWFSETAAVKRSVFMDEITRGPIYFEHLGAGPSLDVVSAARDAGFPVYAETCPHYLCFSEEVYRTPHGVAFLKSPPLRRKEDCESLWQGIAHGSISSVATDESLALIVEKRRLAERLPAYEVSGGLNQIELRLAVMHNEMVIQRGMAVEKLVYLLATAPAMIFGLYPRKGTIAIGSDADLVLFDPKIRKQIRNKDLHQGTDHTIFEGWEVQGFPKMTLSRGKVLVEDGGWVGPDSEGQWLERQNRSRCHRSPGCVSHDFGQAFQQKRSLLWSSVLLAPLEMTPAIRHPTFDQCSGNDLRDSFAVVITPNFVVSRILANR